MSKNKFLNLFKKDAGRSNPSVSQEEEKQDKNAMDKKFVQEIINLIGKKLKDPSMAKKAAQIVEEMIQEKTYTHTNQNRYTKNKKSA
ncbi:MAG: hypothetical protein HN576_10850 [Bacteriovoracaceae bacterium]|jgi:hypothetical protein|nr:hypothetical protein [Bacteriovoracaceae bacterium]